MTTIDEAPAAEPLVVTVTRILDEHSAWIAQPNPEVASRIAFAAAVAMQAQSPPSEVSLLHDRLYDVTRQRDSHSEELQRAGDIIDDLKRRYEILLASEEENRKKVEEAAKAGWNACRKSLYAVCEDAASEGEKNRDDTENPPRHHFGRGQMSMAKSIARGFNSMEAEDDDNFTVALAAFVEREEKR